MSTFQEELAPVLEKLDTIEALLNDPRKLLDDTFITNDEFIQMMGICGRTSQNWRDQGLISFSQIGRKIYFRMSDVAVFLENYCREAFEPLGRV